MTFVPANLVAQVEVRGLYLGSVVENTLYARVTAPFDAIVASEVAECVQAWWTGIRISLSDQLVLTEVYITDLSTQTSPTYSFAAPTPEQGGNTGPAMPGNVSFCISFRTAGRGRSSRGRNYVIGMTETTVTGNLVAGSVVNNIVAAYNTFRTELSNRGFQHVVVSRFLNGVARTSALVQPVTAILATDNVIDSQRRRLTGRGN